MDSLIAAVSQLTERQRQVHTEAQCWNCKEFGHYRFQCLKPFVANTQEAAKGKDKPWGKKKGKGKKGKQGTNETKDSETSDGQTDSEAKPKPEVKTGTNPSQAAKPAGNGGKT
jgi:hypothetical protein